MSKMDSPVLAGIEKVGSWNPHPNAGAAKSEWCLDGNMGLEEESVMECDKGWQFCF